MAPAATWQAARTSPFSSPATWHTPFLPSRLPRHVSLSPLNPFRGRRLPLTSLSLCRPSLSVPSLALPLSLSLPLFHSQLPAPSSSPLLLCRRHGRSVLCHVADGDKDSPDDMDLEMEIFQFMQTAGTPDAFPTERQLARAGREDLVEAVLRQGGWLAVGWERERARQRKWEGEVWGEEERGKDSERERDREREQLRRVKGAPEYKGEAMLESWAGGREGGEGVDRRERRERGEGFRREGDMGKEGRETADLTRVLGFDPWGGLPSASYSEERTAEMAAEEVGRGERGGGEEKRESWSESERTGEWWRRERGYGEMGAENTRELEEGGREGGRDGRREGEGERIEEKEAPRRWQRKKPRGYWSKDENLRRELEEFSFRAGHPSLLPTSQELWAARRADLEGAVKRRGGWKVLEQLFGFQGQTVQGSPRQNRQYRFTQNGQGKEEGREGEGEGKEEEGLPGAFDWKAIRGRSLSSTFADIADFTRQWSLERQPFTAKQNPNSSVLNGKKPANPPPRRWRRTQKQRQSTEVKASSQNSLLSQRSLSTPLSTSLPFSSHSPGNDSPPPPSLPGFSVLRRIRALESSLSATRAALQSGREALLSSEEDARQVREDTVKELVEVTDSLEFRESEIMRTRQELRNTKAEVLALEGKLGAGLRNAKQSLEDSPSPEMPTTPTTRPVRVVWPNPGTDVLLTGSFDNWQNKVKMEKSTAGVFVSTLQLNPGSYEIKFIVDGKWQIDPQRPIVYTHGSENNLLIVF